MMALPDVTINLKRCVLIAAFFVSITFASCAEEPLGVFSAAPNTETKPVQPKTPPIPAQQSSKEQNAADIATVVDLSKKNPSETLPSVPPLPVEAVPAGVVTTVRNAYLQDSVTQPAPPASPVPAPTTQMTTQVQPPVISEAPAALPTPQTSAPQLRPVRSFKDIAALPDDQFDIAEAILALGMENDYELSETPGKTLKRLNDIAARGKEQLPQNPDCTDYFDALYDVVLNRRPIEPIHDERADDYDLSCAVFQHKGSCLSMGIFALAVAKRMGAPIEGAQCPNHFFLRGSGVVKGRSSEIPLNFDVTRPTPDDWTRLDDAFYRKWRHFDLKSEDAGEYLRPLNARQVVAAYLASRAGYLGRERKYDAALSDAERALQLNPRNVNAMINAGFAKEAQHKYEDAENYYKQAIELDSQNIRALNNLAYVKVRDKKSSIFDPRKSEKLINQAIAIDPDQSYLYATRGEVFAARGDYKEATRSMQTALNLSPKNAAYRERFMGLRDHLRSETR